MAFEDVVLDEVACCECGKPISSIPPWLSTAAVKFECEECRSRHPRMPGMELETRRGSYADADEVGEVAEAGEDAADEDAEDETEEAEEYGE